MAEIKSTLDLVMERTKHLQLSDRERRQQKDKESGARLRGLIQKLADQFLSEDQFAKEYLGLKSEYDLTDDSGLVSECIEKLAIKGDNQAVLAALNSADGFDHKAAKAVIEEFQNRYHDLLAGARERLRDAYADRYQISGNAVLTNPNRDPQFQRDVETLESEFRQRLSEAVEHRKAAKE